MINVRFPSGENMSITYDDYEQDFNNINNMLFENKEVVSIAKGNCTDTYIVIATINHALYFFDHEHNFTFINSSLSLFISFQIICQHFFTKNPEI